MKQRDPRINPLPGDRLMDSRGQVVIVPSLARGESRSIGAWRRRMRNARVLYAVDAGWACVPHENERGLWEQSR